MQIAVRLKSESLLSKTDLTVGDFVPATQSGLHRDRSLSEILNDSTDHSLAVLQPIKIHSRDSDDDDNVIDDDVSDDDVISDEVGNAGLIDDSDEDVDDRKMNSPPIQPVRPGPPPKPKRSNVEPEHGSKKNDSPVKTKPARPKPFSKTAVSSPTNKRKTPPNRPGRPPTLPAEKTPPPTARSCNPTPPARQRTEGEAANIVNKPSLPQRPVSEAVEKKSLDNAGKPFHPEKPERSVFVDHESRPIPPSRLEENLQGQAAGSSKPTAPPRRPSFKAEESSVHEAKPMPPARPQSYAEHISEKSGLDNQTKHVAPVISRNEEKPTDNALSTKSVAPPPRPATPPHRPPPPSVGKPPVSKDKDIQARSQKTKEANQHVKESEGQSFRQRLGTLSKFTRKQQREEVKLFLEVIKIK